MDADRKRALLVGHFSTVGDVECLRIVREWLDESRFPCDVACFFADVAAQLDGVTDLRGVDPSAYTHLVVICGPVWQEQFEQLRFDPSRFRHCVRIGVNLTLVGPLAEWNPFDVLLERDSERATRPDLSLCRDVQPVPVVGRCLVRGQGSYRGRHEHRKVERLFEDLARQRGFAVIDLDTRWCRRGNGIRSPAQFVAALQRVDLLLTNRLHGMVYALKAGVPVVAIDAVRGGAKVSAQAKKLGWPMCIPIEEATPERLSEAVDWCGSEEAREAVRASRESARPPLEELKREFQAAMAAGITPSFLHPYGGPSAWSGWAARARALRRRVKRVLRFLRRGRRKTPSSD